MTLFSRRLASSGIIQSPATSRPASMPMYTLAGCEKNVADWWQGLAGHLREAGVDLVPDRLEHSDDPLIHWLDKDLLFSQTCGFPLTRILSGHVRMIATPKYAAPGCRDTNYCSMIIVPMDSDIRALDDLHYLDAAVNSLDSHSGCNILRATLSDIADPNEHFFRHLVISGSHAQSITLLCKGQVQCAAIDCVTLALIRQNTPEQLAGIRILCETEQAPGLPFITRAKISDGELEKLRVGLFTALADPAMAELNRAQLLDGAEIMELETYDRILEIEKIAQMVIL